MARLSQGGPRAPLAVGDPRAEEGAVFPGRGGGDGTQRVPRARSSLGRELSSQLDAEAPAFQAGAATDDVRVDVDAFRDRKRPSVNER